MTMLEAPRVVVGGVDTHANVHVAAALDTATGALLGCMAFPTTPNGYGELLAWLVGHGRIDRVGVEGTGSYGAGLLRHLRRHDITVVEVDRPDRKARRLHGKSDPVDAEAAARAVLSGKANGTPKARDGQVEAIRALNVVLRSSVKDRTRAINQFKALTITAPEQVRASLDGLHLNQQISRAGRWRDTHPDPLSRQVRYALRELARLITGLRKQAARLEQRLRDLITAHAPALLDVSGVGVHTAARLLIAAGDNPQRLRSEAAFAHLCGVAPIEASSGQRTRHRLNRHGDRSANHALWRIVMVRRTHDERTRAYFARRRAEGLSDRDIMRCLKRYVTREIHRVLTNPPPPAPHAAELRQLRKEVGVSLRLLATHVDGHPSRLSDIELGKRRDPALQRRTHAWLTEQKKLLLTT
jgi:transposase